MIFGTERIDREKSALRAELLRRREAAHNARHPAAGAALSARFFAQFEDTLADKTVAAYWPIREEIDVRPLLSRLASCSAIAALPVMTGQTQPLSFRLWSPADTLVSAAFSVCEPDPASPEAVPDIVIVPLLGFDDAGNRIGYGGGYYDCTLNSLRRDRDVKAVGVAYDEQECEKIPVGAGDARLDMVFTDRRTVLPGENESTD